MHFAIRENLPLPTITYRPPFFYLPNYCYLVGLKHGLLLSESKGDAKFYFSAALDAYPCVFHEQSIFNYIDGFHDGRRR